MAAAVGAPAPVQASATAVAPPITILLSPVSEGDEEDDDDDKSDEGNVLSDVTAMANAMSRAQENASKGSLQDELLSRKKKLKKAEGPKCFARNIPGGDSMSFTDLIKVSARVKLRQTAVPRSPGGTPLRRPKPNNTVDELRMALMRKFKNVASTPERGSDHLHPHDRVHHRQASEVDSEWEDYEN